MPSVILGDTVFNTKKDAIKYFKEMLWGGQAGVPIGEPGHTDLCHLLERHPEFKTKRGTGVHHFSVHDTLFKAREFEIVRHDGSIDGFSFYKCLEPPASVQRQIIDALRAEVCDEILAKKEEYFREHGDDSGKIACALTGELITLDECHADHAGPYYFATLATLFIAARGRDFPQSATILTEWPDDPHRQRLANRGLAEDWRRFHHLHAHIRLVSRTENMARAREGRPNPKDMQLSLTDLLDDHYV